ncbi:MAG TPA: tRNA lysidine(34) synthetase TilS [Bacteroidia bacterium]|nr:tRNA lysidine(34) synthetase TilS [Bacteroidia bacterium]
MDGWDASCRWLVGVSGGLDSMVLWRLLREAGFHDLVVVHVDHGLRGKESDADAEFVAAEAKRLETPCEIRRVDVGARAREAKLSVETAARELRYAAFAEVAEKWDCPRLFLAHHADDQVETVLMRLFRGAGSRGLAGMERETTRRIGGTELRIVRPLLGVCREQLADEAARLGVPYREDGSNRSHFALRNRIRHRLLPEIEAVFGRDVRKSILRAAELAALDEAWATGELGSVETGGVLDVAEMRSFPEARRNRLLLSWLRGSGVPDCGLAEVARAAEVLLSDARPAKASLPGGHHVRRRAGALFIEPPSSRE